MVHARQATRTYTESEALNLSVLNLTYKWRSEICHLLNATSAPAMMVRCRSNSRLPNSRLHSSNTLPIGRDPPSSSQRSSSIIRRIETACPDFSSKTDTTLDDEAIDLMVLTISQNQDALSLCLGCHLLGHKLEEECNRFVDYIVAESLAQRNPHLEAQIANSH
jgi:hypothetical protein